MPDLYSGQSANLILARRARWDRTTPYERFLARLLGSTVVRQDGCIEWTGPRVAKGYGRVKLIGGKKTAIAHRVIYEMFVGPIPPGLQIDHLCNRPWCVAPDHLEPVTCEENIRRRDRRAS